MEAENPQQQINQGGNFNQNPTSVNPVLNQRGNLLLVLGIVVLVFVVGAGAYYFGTKQTQIISQPQQSTPVTTTQPLPTSLPTNSPSSSTTANWKIYSNQKWGLSIKYPQNLYVKEFEFCTSFTFEPYPAGEGLGPLDLIKISLKCSYIAQVYSALYKANQGDDVSEAHNAVDVKVTKLRNLKFGNYDAVEYIRDGLTLPRSGLGRGPIGYEHHVLIKKSDQEFIDLINQTMEVEKTKQRDPIFNYMASSLILN